MKILIVDDDKENLYMLETLLLGQGYEVVSAADGEEALEKALHDDFDLIISDILMPRMDGFQLCREVKADGKLKKIAFVFYTATYTDSKDEEFALSLGVEKFIVKPTEPDIFIEILKEVIRSYKTGTLAAPKPPVEKETVYFKRYNELLVRKLEDKMLQLQSINKTLVESERKYRELIDNASDAVMVVEPTGCLSFVNSKFCEMMGHSMEEAKKLQFSKLVHPEDLAMVTENFRKGLAGEEVPMNYEFRGLTRAGETIYVEYNSSTIEREGRIVGVLGIVRDITERKRAVEALRASKERFDSLVNRLNDVVWTASADGSRIVDVNHAFSKVYGVSEDDLRSNPVLWIEMVHPDDRKIAEDSREELLRSGQAQAEYRIVRPDGEIRWIRDRKSLVYDEEGNVVQMGGIANDITVLKQKEMEKDKLREQLNQAQKMEAVGRLAGGVAHDFNNMLTAILGYADLAMMQLKPSDELYADLVEIRKAGQCSADLTRQLLAFARKQTVSPKVLHLNDTVAEMLNILQLLIGEDIEVLWKPSDNLWPVKIDPSQIDQVLANLAVNARDAIAGVGKFTIETENVTFDKAYCDEHTCFVPGQFVMLAVSDDGYGMDKATLNKVFEPFFTTKELGKGTGLGLATVYGIVKQNQGLINVYSEAGQGTTFEIYLPRFAGTVRDKEDARDEEIPRGRGETLLLVEDELQILNMGKRLLEKLGYRVLTADKPREAVRIAQEHRGAIDLLLTDVVMPEMNGRDLSQRIQVIQPGIKLLFMSGYAANAIAHHGVLDQGTLFVQKPLDARSLAVKIRAALEQK